MNLILDSRQARDLTWDLGGVTSSQSTCVAASVPIGGGNSRLRAGRRAPHMSIASLRNARALAGANNSIGQIIYYISSRNLKN